jgi:hypothetical protein
MTRKRQTFAPDFRLSKVFSSMAIKCYLEASAFSENRSQSIRHLIVARLPLLLVQALDELLRGVAQQAAHPEMEFLDIKLTKVLSLFLRELFTVPSTGRFNRKPYSSLVLKKTLQKNPQNKKSQNYS